MPYETGLDDSYWFMELVLELPIGVGTGDKISLICFSNSADPRPCPSKLFSTSLIILSSSRIYRFIGVLP